MPRNSEQLSTEDELCVFFMNRLQRRERFGDVFLSGELREKDAADHSQPVDDVRHASWQPESRRDAVTLSDYAIRITQQDEGELVRCSELPMRLYRVRADPDNFRPSLFEEFVAVPKGTRFGCADSRVISRVEVQHNVCLTENPPKAYWFARLVREGKIRGRVAHLHFASGWLYLLLTRTHYEVSFFCVIVDHLGQ
jgi:hypothetical protein